MEPLRVQAEDGRVVQVPAHELSWTAVRASGPGGQNVNKVASKVELRFTLEASVALSPSVKARLRAQVAHAIDADGVLRVVSQRTREQPRNLQDALEKLAAMIARAMAVPKPRRPTKPTFGSQKRRLNEKSLHGQKKQSRRGGFDE